MRDWLLNAALEYKKTGIRGLDTILNGGIPQGWIVIVSGSPGAGKSTLALEFIYRGALEYHEPGVIVTFNETKPQIFKTFKGFGWDFEKLEKEGIISIIDYSTSSLVYLEKVVKTGKFTLDFISGQIMREITEINAKRAIIDPLNTLSQLFPNEFQIRREIHRLFSLLSSADCTTMCTLELKKPEIGNNEFLVEEFVAQGLIRLYYSQEDMSRLRRLEVMKMKGVKQETNIYPFEIDEKGILIKTESEDSDIEEEGEETA